MNNRQQYFIANYENRLNAITFRIRESVCRRNLIYGIQPECTKDGDPQDHEFQKKKIYEIAKLIILNHDVGVVPPPCVVMFKGTPVVVDGHHRVRAMGAVNAFASNQSELKGFRIDIVQVDIIDLNQYLNAMGWTVEQFEEIVNYASGTFIQAVEQYENVRHKRGGLRPQLPFVENLGFGVMERDDISLILDLNRNKDIRILLKAFFEDRYSYLELLCQLVEITGCTFEVAEDTASNWLGIPKATLYALWGIRVDEL